jgi:Ca2+-binding RTX toxin-like protein
MTTVHVYGGNNTVLTGNGDDMIFDDPAQTSTGTVIGSSGDDVIRAGGGADTIFTGDGHNTYDGGTGIDTVNYSRSSVGILVDLAAGTGSGDGTDTIISIENVVGSINRDIIYGSDVDNVLSGGKGNDSLYGGDGHDTLFGGADDDFLVGGAGADTMYGEDGIDTIWYGDSPAGVTIDLAHGTGKGGDAEGDAFKYVENVTGSRFSDLLIGNGGNNVLTGGQGQDTLIGGAGHDMFVFGRFGFGGPTDSTVAAPDLIKDFTPGEDVMDLRPLLGYSFGGQQHLSLVDDFTGAGREVTVDVLSGSTMIYADLNGDKVADFTLQLSDPMHLTASDFLL